MKKIALVLLILAVAVPAMAQVDQGDMHRAKRAVIQFLQLTEDQVAQWDGLLEARETAMAPLREALQAVEGDLRELLAGEDPDPTAVGTLVIEGKALREAMGDVHREYVEGFQLLLDEEQAQRLGGIRRAEQLQPLFPAFRLFGLLPPHDGPGPR